MAAFKSIWFQITVIDSNGCILSNNVVFILHSLLMQDTFLNQIFLPLQDLFLEHLGSKEPGVLS